MARRSGRRSRCGRSGSSCWSARAASTRRARRLDGAMRAPRASTKASPACWCQMDTKGINGASDQEHVGRLDVRRGVLRRPVRVLSRIDSAKKAGLAGDGVGGSRTSGRRSPRSRVCGRKLEELKELARKSRKNGRAALEDDGIRRRIARFERRRSRGCASTACAHSPSSCAANRSARRPRSTSCCARSWRWRSARSPGDAGQAPVTWNAKWNGGRWQRFALSWPEVVIGGGTPNIQKNIIAERVLGLPKD